MSESYRTHELAHIIAVDKAQVTTPAELNAHIEAVKAALIQTKKGD